MANPICPTCKQVTHVIKCGKVRQAHRRVKQWYQCNECGGKFVGEIITGGMQS